MNGGRGLGTIHYSFHYSLRHVYRSFVNLSSPSFQILFYGVSFFVCSAPTFCFNIFCIISPFDRFAVVVWFSFLCCYTLLFLSRIILFCLLL